MSNSVLTVGSRKCGTCLLLPFTFALLSSLTSYEASGFGWTTTSYSGTYLANYINNDAVIMFVELTQSNTTVTGSLSIVRATGGGGTTQETLALSGNLDGANVSLMAKRKWPQDDLNYHGMKSGDKISLSLPLNSGGFATTEFLPAPIMQFNLLVYDWQVDLANAFERRRVAIAENIAKQQAVDKEKSDENEALTTLAEKLNQSLRLLKQTGIPDNIRDLNSDVEDERLALQLINVEFARLKHDAAFIPMTCYQAYQTVSYDFRQSLGYEFNQSLGYPNHQFAARRKELETRLANSERAVMEAKHASELLGASIRTAKYGAVDLAAKPDETSSTIREYESIVASARAELTRLNDQNKQIVESAQGIIQNGQEVTKQAISRAGYCGTR